MARKIKRHILLPIIFLLYFAVMAVMAYPRYEATGNWSEYFLVIGICLLLVLFLFLILKRRQKVRDRYFKNN